MADPSTPIASTPKRRLVMTPRRWATLSAICFLAAAYYLCYEHFPVHVTKDTPLYRATRNGKQGIVTIGGRVVVPFEWDEIPPFDEHGLAVVSKSASSTLRNFAGKATSGRRYGVLRRDGHLLIEPQLIRCAHRFDQEGQLVAVDDTGLLWTFDVDGNRRCFGEWNADMPLSFGKAGLMPVGNFWASGWIDRSGKLVLRLSDGLTAASPFVNDSFALVRNEVGQLGTVDMQGSIVIPTDWDDLIVHTEPGSKIILEGTREKESDEYEARRDRVFMRPDGSVILPFAYEKASLNFLHERIFVTTENKSGVCDFDGKELIPMEFDQWDLWSAIDNLAIRCVKNGKVGLFDHSGKVLLPCDHDEVSVRNFTEYSFVQQVPRSDVILATFRDKEKYGAINGLGTVVIPARYEETQPLRNHPKLVSVREGKLWGCLNAKGETIVPIQYHQVIGMPWTGEIAAQADGHWDIYEPDGDVRRLPCAHFVFPLDINLSDRVKNVDGGLTYQTAIRDISSRRFFGVDDGANSRGVISSTGQTIIPAIHHTVQVTPDGFLAYGIARSDRTQDRFLRQYTTILCRYLPSLVTPTDEVCVLYDFDGNVIWRNDARLFDFLKAFGLSCWGLYCFRKYRVAKREQRVLQTA